MTIFDEATAVQRVADGSAWRAAASRSDQP